MPTPEEQRKLGQARQDLKAPENEGEPVPPPAYSTQGRVVNGVVLTPGRLSQLQDEYKQKKAAYDARKR